MCLCSLKAANFGVFPIIFIGFHICTIKINCIGIEENEVPDISVNNTGVYFLCMKSCSLLDSHNILNTLSSLNYIERNQRHLIFYPIDIFLKFEFFEQNIIKKYDNITIYMQKKDFIIFSYLSVLLKAEDSIMNLDLNFVFEILKYLNIFNVRRNKKYRNFIKYLVFYSTMTNKKCFLQKSTEFLLFYREYNNLIILDMIERIFRFYLIKKLFIYETFHEYVPITFLRARYTDKKYKTNNNVVSMQFRNFYFLSYFSRCFLNPFLHNIWLFMTKIFYIDKLYIDFSILNKDIDIKTIFGPLTQNLGKFSLVLLDESLPMLNNLKRYGHLDYIKNLKLILFHPSIFILESLKYFKSLEKLTLEFSEIKIYEIIELEKNKAFETIKYIKIILCRGIDLQSKISSCSLFGNMKNLFVDLSDTFNLSDFGNNLSNFYAYNFKNYIIGISLKPTYSNSNYLDLENIFYYNLIKQLKFNFKNIEENHLGNYAFLKYFKSLTRLHFINIKLTNDLLGTLLKLDHLKSILFEHFQVSNQINSENWNFTNKNVIYMEFNTSYGSLNNYFLCFIKKFIGLKNLLFDLVPVPDSVNELYFSDEIEDFSVFSKCKNLENIPKLEYLQYNNEIRSAPESNFSILYLFSFFFNLESLKKLVYKIYNLNMKDATVFEKLQKLTYLDLSIKKNDNDLNILQKILQSGIKKTIFKLSVVVDKFTGIDLIYILYFEKLRILKLRAKFCDENDKKFIELLCGMDIICKEIFVSTSIQEIHYS